MWRLLLALLAATLATSGCGRSSSRPPNVIVIVMDTTRQDHLGTYGYRRVVSPRIDEFAADSEVYLRAWSVASWTLPAHASLLTGLWVKKHGAHMRPDLDADSLGDNPPRLSERIVTLAELLSAQGYRTAAFAGAGWLAPEFGLLQGYDVRDAKNLRNILAEELTDRALAWVATVPADEPLHLLVNYFDPHGPYAPPEGYDVFPAANDPVNDVLKKGAGEQMAEDEALAARGSATEPVIDRYDGEILYTDHHIGRLLDGLRELGRYDDSLIVLTADHGEAFGEKGAWGHGAWLYEPLLRIPMIVHRPGGRNAGARRLAPVSLVDVLAMVHEETGIALPDGVDALPPGERELVLAEEIPSAIFKKVKHGDETPLDRDLLAGIQWPYKVIVNFPGRAELYRLDHDPVERHDDADGTAEVALEQAVIALAESLAAPETEAPHPMSEEARRRLRELGYIE